MFRKLISISLILLCICVSAFAYEIPEQTAEFYVNDFAGVLSDETENMIKGSGQRMFDENGMQIVVTTVESLDGAPIEEYSIKMAREYGIGSEKDNGILILLAITERELRIEVGSGLEGELNDAKAGRFMDDYAIPYFVENDFDGGINNLYRALLIEFGLTEVEAPYMNNYNQEEGSWVEILFTIILFGLIVFSVLKSSGKGGGTNGGTGGGYYGGHVGGFGGRSGGSGGFSGGGFRGSGGGGGFRGGGASRKF